MNALRIVACHADPVLADVPVPAPGPGEVLVRVGGAGVCHSDLHLLYDLDEDQVGGPLPFTLGHETAGWVEALGAGVDGPAAGTAVAVYGSWGCGLCPSCSDGAENYCAKGGMGKPVAGVGVDGGMAEYLVVPSPRFLVPLPEGLSPVVAAPLTDAALTSYHAIRRAARVLRPGATAAVIGVGGLGHLAVQLLKITTGVRVVGIDTRPEAIRLAADCGADEGVLADDDPKSVAAEATAGGPVAAVFDFVGNEATVRIARALAAPDGHIGLVGIGGGRVAIGGLGGARPGVTATFTYWGTRGELVDILRLAGAGRLDPRVETFPLGRAPEAYAAVRAGKVSGRAVVVPA